MYLLSFLDYISFISNIINPMNVKDIYKRHDEYCNQKYGKDDLPYSFHLKAVVAQASKYKQLINVNYSLTDLLLAAAGHDLIEDARMTYNDILQDSNYAVAGIIYACTEEKGKNRDERHSQKFFDELKQNRLAVYVKLCDIMANVLYSLISDSSMYDKYQKEFPRLYRELYEVGEYELLWNDLKTLLKQ